MSRLIDPKEQRQGVVDKEARRVEAERQAAADREAAKLATRAQHTEYMRGYRKGILRGRAK